MLPRGLEDAGDVRFSNRENISLKDYFTDVFRQAADFVTDVFTCSLAHEIQHHIGKISKLDTNADNHVLQRLLSHVASRLSPDLTLSNLWNSMEPSLLSEIKVHGTAEKAIRVWTAIQALSRAWRLLQDQAIQRVKEGTYFRGVERKISSVLTSSSISSNKADMKSAKSNNALELSFMISKGMRHRADIPPLVCMMFPLMKAIDSATTEVFLDAKTVNQISTSRSEPDLFCKFAELLEAMLCTRRDAFLAFKSLPSFINDDEAQNMDQGHENRSQGLFHHSAQYLCIVLHLSWLLVKAQHAVSFYKKLQKNTVSSDSNNDLSFVHLEHTLTALKQHMAENGIIAGQQVRSLQIIIATVVICRGKFRVSQRLHPHFGTNLAHRAHPNVLTLQMRDHEALISVRSNLGSSILLLLDRLYWMLTP